MAYVPASTTRVLKNSRGYGMLPLGSISSSHPISWGGIGEIWIATPPMVSAATEREREEAAAQPCVVHESLSSFSSKLAFAVCPFS